MLDLQSIARDLLLNNYFPQIDFFSIRSSSLQFLLIAPNNHERCSAVNVIRSTVNFTIYKLPIAETRSLCAVRLLHSSLASERLFVNKKLNWLGYWFVYITTRVTVSAFQRNAVCVVKSVVTKMTFNELISFRLILVVRCKIDDYCRSLIGKCFPYVMRIEAQKREAIRFIADHWCAESWFRVGICILIWKRSPNVCIRIRILFISIVSIRNDIRRCSTWRGCSCNRKVQRHFERLIFEWHWLPECKMKEKAA